MIRQTDISSHAPLRRPGQGCAIVTNRSGIEKHPPRQKHPAPPQWTAGLLAWYTEHRRDLPWRRTRGPYTVWISEIMLQQTQVDTALPYYRRFLSRFPTVRRLAAADLQDVLKAWEGLGYYSRARNLHRAAQEVVGRLNGRLPSDAAALQALPGIGDYTAAAIASICFGQPIPVVDGNVQRVFARFLGLRNPAGPAMRRRIAGYLATRLPPAEPGDFNQACMELGALVCRPRNPACQDCPLRPQCRAVRTGKPEQFPARSPRRKGPHLIVVACVIRRLGRVLIAQRKTDQMLGGLWEFPGGKQEPGETLEETARREILEETGMTVRPVNRLCVVNHAYSHFSITLHALECVPERGQARPLHHSALRWARIAELRSFPFSAADIPIIGRLESQRAPGASGSVGGFRVHTQQEVRP